MKSPIIFAEGSYAKEDIEKLKKEKPSCQVIDVLTDQLAELFEVLHPNLDPISSDETYQAFISNKAGYEGGNWVYYPWSNQLVHMVNADDFFTLRTNRNQYLVTADEQQELQKYTVAILGLSVGSSIAHVLAHGAVVGEFILADKDNFSTSNMNRVQIKVSDVTKPKLDVLMQQLYEANPYAQITGYERGVDRSNIDDLFKKQKLIIIDEMDDFEMKVRVRMKAKKHGVPVVMLTSLGDNILVDIERYDLDKRLRPFNGLIDGVVGSILSGQQITEGDKKRYAVRIVGVEHVPTRALESVRDIGRQLVGRPQLFGSVTISGGIAAYIVRQIGLGINLDSGRYFFSMADLLKQPRLDLELNERRKRMIKIMNHKPPTGKKFHRPPYVNPSQFYLAASAQEKISHLLEYAILAPSTHNTQPWKIKIKDRSCQVYIDSSRQLPAADKLRRDMYISLGAFLHNLETAARSYGVFHKTELSDQKGNLIGEVYFKGLDKKTQGDYDEDSLKAIQTRSNYRGPFAPLAITDELRRRLSKLESNKLKIKLIEDRWSIEELANLTASGLKLAYKDPTFRKEISSWINPNSSRKRSGIPGYALRMPALTSQIIPRILKYKDIGEKLAKLNYQSFVGASGVVVVSASESNPKVWLSVGQASQEIFLALEKMGAVASIYVAAVEMGNLEKSVSKIIKLHANQKPQFLFCIGRPIWPKVYSPREQLRSKLIS
ncbi:hypothetical protein A3F38_02865 [Candidatus Saccharibacteria bacterium RIFCSPHIGHO2_12_FULL_48_21]|nr:MAG: hypothetical protein A3F38_02865 [Candidatus Saccharibacteria bacterium RIFCSPHIGHO2_12_FULL_48_21]